MRTKSLHSKWPYCRLKLIYTLLCLALIHGFSAARAQDAGHATAGSHAEVVAPHPNGLEAGAEQNCVALQRANFATIPDAATEITSAAKVKAGTEPAFCQVKGIVHPQVEFEIRLPLTTWNGKFFETGCAAMCGVTYIDSLCPSLLRKGYACIASDMGHHGKITNGVWAYNNLEAEVDFGYRAAHVTALAGKAITQYFYGRSPEKSYFCGCSTGGREGLVEAQRFPWDFDGIIAGAPASDQSGTIMVRLWAALAMRGHDGRPVLSSDDLQFIHKAVVEACDLNDGVKDGLIGDPRVCTFDPATLACNASSHGRCLAREQIDALLKMYNGPVQSDGQQIYADGRLMRGSELGFADYFGGGRFSAFDTDFMRYMGFFPDPGPTWQVDDLNFDRDYKRFGMMESLYAATNPDLRRFKAHGGKLIVYQGWADGGSGGIPPLKAVDYYETTERTMGGPAATKDFFRFFAIPGMGHCGGGEGPDHIYYVKYLEEWSERGRAPDVIIGTHLNTARLQQFLGANDANSYAFSTRLEQFLDDPQNTEFSRPIYPYPVGTVYKGAGDPRKAENFRPAP